MRIWSAVALVVLVGCGSSSGDGSDGGADSAAADATVDAPTHGEVTVVVLDGGEPVQGVAVYFHDTDGAQLGELATNSSGLVIIGDMPAGGAVTIVRGIGLESLLGVEVGDTVTFDTPDFIRSLPSAWETLNVTTPGIFDGLTSYNVHTKCSSSNSVPPSTVDAPYQLNTGCIGETSIDVLAYGIDGGERVNASFAPNVALGAGPIVGSAVLPDPSSVSELQMTTPMVAGSTADLSVRPYRGDQSLGATSQALSVAAAGTTSVALADDVFEKIVIRMRVRPDVHPDGLISGERILQLFETATLSGVQAVSLESLLPPINSIAVDVGAAGGSVAFTTDGEITCGTIGAADMTRFSIRGFVGTGVLAVWDVVVEGSPTSLTLPTFGNPATPWPATSFDTVAANVEILAHNTLGWAELHQRPIVARSGLYDQEDVGSARCTASAGTPFPIP